MLREIGLNLELKENNFKARNYLYELKNVNNLWENMGSLIERHFLSNPNICSYLSGP